jgi:hypothetical protein
VNDECRLKTTKEYEWNVQKLRSHQRRKEYAGEIVVCNREK